MINLNNKIIISEGHSITISEVHFNIENEKNPTATIITKITDENGDVVKTIVNNFAGQEAQEAWDAFITKKSLYEISVEKNELDASVPEMDDVIYVPKDDIVTE